MMNRSRPAQRSYELMVVDDDEVLREAFVTTLEREGHRVHEHESGSAALHALADRERPDIILLDLQMPGMDGWEFRRRQLASAKLRSIPVIAISADPSPQAAAVHADAFVPKPVELANLLRTIDTVMQRHRDLRRRRFAWLSRAGHATPRRLSRRAHPPFAQRAIALQAEAQLHRQLAFVANGITHLVNNAFQGLVSHIELGESHTGDALSASAVCGAALECAGLLRAFAASATIDMLRPLPAPLGAVSFDALEVWWTFCRPGISLRVVGLDQLREARLTLPQLIALTSELIKNAVEALGGVGEIEVSASAQWRGAADFAQALPLRNQTRGHYCVLEVKDTGSGIAAEQRRDIWAPFYSTRFAGRGLGLASVLACMTALGGLVECTSGPGRGATFRLLFPIPSPGASAAPGHTGRGLSHR